MVATYMASMPAAMRGRRSGVTGNRRQAGMSMLETLVTIAVIAIALLGIAGMQMEALRGSQRSDLAAIAMLRVQDLIERMRVNPVGVAADLYDSLDTSIPNLTVDCASSACTAPDLAVFDHNRWNTQNAQALPGGRGRATDDGNNGIFWIAVLWTDKTLDCGGSGKPLCWDNSAGADALAACGAPTSGVVVNTRCFYVRSGV